ncbi:ComEC/Rec2 family competence protein [Patiriisocius hiemis]|uniref:ComEC/Rec2 family competence protein n=1 Tax=Patiriisocius hiemis TaxID=3075604 RepID=A0ABU2YEU2_9FLAO|nr:ComEC/Rec2 family competence protein [Constantimarinum sp. W242]MDT0556262.1 ComEC/Rec2 family competence protein [Constantimarinum sp. W242]
MKFLNHVILHFSIALTLGIVVAYFTNLSILGLGALVIIAILFLCVTGYISNKKLQPSILFTVAVYGIFFSIGITNYQLRLPHHLDNHYINTSTSEASHLQIKITEILKPDIYNTKYIGEVVAINENKSKGKILVSIRKDSIKTRLGIDDVILVKTEIKPIQSPLNPHQFDYAKYMKNLNVYEQIRVNKEEIVYKSNGQQTLRGIADGIRNHLIEKLNNAPISVDERSVIQALVLGQKRDIDRDLYRDYAAAGAIHILAVSGLHVGILYFLFSFILRPIKVIKHGNYIQPIIVIILLWGFALLTGMSPSVTRAVTMFSFFGLAKLLNRPTSTVNTLFSSYFILLLIFPKWLFHVGFQLSYLAVLSIILIQPKLSSYFKPKNYILRKGWDILTVTVAAQIGLLPLSIYYFHQFPGLFFITNLVVLPFLGIALGFGLLVVVLAALEALPGWLAIGYSYVIEALNNFIRWVAQQDVFIVKDISFSIYTLLLSYVLIACILLLWKKYSYKKLIASLCSFCFLIGVFIWDVYRTSGSELVIFNKTAHTIIGVKNASELRLFKTDTTSYKDKFPIQSYRVAQHIKTYSEEILPNYFIYKSKKILVIDSLAVYPKKLSIDIVILTESPKMHLDRILDSLQPSRVIADGSNYKSSISRWKATCDKRKLPFHHTGTKGAFIIE